jgi:hypothetical protein
MKARTRCPWLPNQKNKLYYPSYLRDMVSIPVVNWPLVGSKVNRHIWKHLEAECEVEHDNGCGILGAWMLLNFWHLRLRHPHCRMLKDKVATKQIMLHVSLFFWVSQSCIASTMWKYLLGWGTHACDFLFEICWVGFSSMSIHACRCMSFCPNGLKFDARFHHFCMQRWVLQTRIWLYYHTKDSCLALINS